MMVAFDAFDRAAFPFGHQPHDFFVPSRLVFRLFGRWGRRIENRLAPRWWWGWISLLAFRPPRTCRIKATNGIRAVAAGGLKV